MDPSEQNHDKEIGASFYILSYPSMPGTLLNPVSMHSYMHLRGLVVQNTLQNHFLGTRTHYFYFFNWQYLGILWQPPLGNFPDHLPAHAVSRNPRDHRGEAGAADKDINETSEEARPCLFRVELLAYILWAPCNTVWLAGLNTNRPNRLNSFFNN